MREDRAASSVVGVVVLVAVTVGLAGVVGVAATAIDDHRSPGRASIAVTASPGSDRIAIEHRGGETLPIAALRVVVAVDGTRLRHQPPVPFFAARGFASGPTGAFNPAADGRFGAGDRTTFRLAGTNAPTIDSGDEVEVRLYEGETLVATRAVRA
ncbi:type IV pilin [Halobacteriales archaeon SW_7_68_16]|nr:MAG: type IV pilin [Halobacteriales archaeon SW_7_68_16]